MRFFAALLGFLLLSALVTGCDRSGSLQQTQQTTTLAVSNNLIILYSIRTGPSTNLIVTNVGAATAYNITADTTALPYGVELTTDNCEAPLAPGASCTIQVDSSLDASGVGSTIISGSNTNAHSVVIKVISLTLTPGDYVHLNQQKIQVMNPNAQVITLQSPTVSDGFSIIENNCADILAPSATCDMTIEATPTNKQPDTIGGNFDIMYSTEEVPGVGLSSINLISQSGLYAAGNFTSYFRVLGTIEGAFVPFLPTSLSLSAGLDIVKTSNNDLCFLAKTTTNNYIVQCYNGSVLTEYPNLPVEFIPTMMAISDSDQLCVAGAVSNQAAVFCLANSLWVYQGTDSTTYLDLPTNAVISGISFGPGGELYASLSGVSAAITYIFINNTWSQMPSQPEVAGVGGATDSPPLDYFTSSGLLCTGGSLAQNNLQNPIVDCFSQASWNQISTALPLINNSSANVDAVAQQNQFMCAAAVSSDQDTGYVACSENTNSTWGAWMQLQDSFGNQLFSNSSISNAGMIGNHGLVIDADNNSYFIGAFNQFGDHSVSYVMQCTNPTASSPDCITSLDGLDNPGKSLVLATKVIEVPLDGEHKS